MWQLMTMKEFTNSDELLINKLNVPNGVVTKVAGIKLARTRTRGSFTLIMFVSERMRKRERCDRQRAESSASIALKTSPRAEEDGLSEGGEIYLKR